ncbi:MAG: hypothetical protein ACJAUP_002896 [Cellvibrionaceae bacterium]
MATDENIEPEKAVPKKVSFSERLVIAKPWLLVGGLILLLVMLMVTSIVTGLMVTGVININPDNKQVVSSMGDAMSICEGAIQDEQGALLQAFAVDDLSSHGDDASGGYRLFYKINKYRDVSRQTGVDRFYVNCFVSAKGRIKRLDFIEDKVFVPRAARKSKGNEIGL